MKPRTLIGLMIGSLQWETKSRYCMLCYSPVLAQQLDYLWGLLNQGAPHDALARFVLGQMLAMGTLSISNIYLVFLLAKRFARPRFASWALDYVQTLLVCVACACLHLHWYVLMVLALGIMTSVQNPIVAQYEFARREDNSRTVSRELPLTQNRVQALHCANLRDGGPIFSSKPGGSHCHCCDRSHLCVRYPCQESACCFKVSYSLNSSKEATLGII